MVDVPRILMVEDVATDAMLIELELRRAGLECTTRRVETADELVRALRHFSPDVVLSDHALPQFGAKGTLEIVQSRSPDTPVIIVTGGLDEETAVDYIKAGATDYVIKHRLERLAPAVMRALSLRRARTEKHQAEDELGRSEARHKAILDGAPDAVITMDGAGTITAWNPRAEMIFGWPASEVLGQRFSETIIPPRDREAHEHALAHFLTSGEGPLLNRRIETTALHRDGSELPVELTITAVPAGVHWLFTAFLRDLSERRRLAQRREAQYAVTRVLITAPTVADAAPRILQAICEGLDWSVGHFWCVESDARVLRCSAMWCAPGLEIVRLRAATQNLVLPIGAGMPGRAWAAGEPVWIEDVSKLFHTDSPRHEYATEAGLRGLFILPIKTGAEIAGVMEFFSRAIQQPDADLLEMAGALGRQIGQFIEQRRATAALRLAGGLAHDVNTLEAAIMGHSDLLLHDLAAEDPRRELVGEIRLAAEQATGLACQLLTFSGRGGLEPQVLDLNEVVTGSERLLRGLIGRDIELVTRLAPQLGSVKAAASQLVQVIVNLAVNAGDAMPGGGQLTIETHSVELAEPQATAHGRAPVGRYLVLAVSDTGIGMDEETQAHLFEPFFTTKAPGRGIGLGLATVDGIVRLSGGFISVQSEPGRGATFQVHLPCIEVEDAGALNVRPSVA